MTASGTLEGLLARGRSVANHRPWPRVEVDRETWQAAGSLLAEGRLDLLGLWGEAGGVHMALAEPLLAVGTPAILSLAAPRGSFPSVGQSHPPAVRLERSLADLYGLLPEGAEDRRPWLDHGRWPRRVPFGTAAPKGEEAQPYAFLSAEGEGLHEIPVGPVHAGIIEPGHFRFSANGETVVRLEARLGYLHKGIEGLFAGSDLRRAAQLAGHISGDSSVAYALAFAQAVESALGITAPPRALWLRAVAAELERVANHLGDFGAIANDASFALLQAQAAVLREEVLRAAAACCGHRLMMGAVLPGGVAFDLDTAKRERLRGLVHDLGRRLGPLVELYDNTASLLDRTVGTGRLSPELALRYAAGGFVGRASGRAFDARCRPGYPPYDALALEPVLRQEGDVDARVWVRLGELRQSFDLLGRILEGLPPGPVMSGLPQPGEAVEGAALVEGFRGDILLWVRLDERGHVARCHARDPSWFQWPLLEAAIEGNIVADFPLCNKSFNCSYAGVDL